MLPPHFLKNKKIEFRENSNIEKPGLKLIAKMPDIRHFSHFLLENEENVRKKVVRQVFWLYIKLLWLYRPDSSLFHVRTFFYYYLNWVLATFVPVPNLVTLFTHLVTLFCDIFCLHQDEASLKTTRKSRDVKSESCVCNSRFLLS